MEWENSFQNLGVRKEFFLKSSGCLDSDSRKVKFESYNNSADVIFKIDDAHARRLIMMTAATGKTCRFTSRRSRTEWHARRLAQRPSPSAARNAERREPWRRYYWRNCAFAVSCAFPTESTCAEGENPSGSTRKKKWYVRTQLSVTVVTRQARNRMPNVSLAV